jgi:hypothetical protein
MTDVPASHGLRLEDVERAYEQWGANCGPAAVAAICGMTLDEVRPVFEAHGFADKHYTNPTMMFAILSALHDRIAWKVNAGHPEPGWPRYGLVRIQWGGEWMRPGVPIRARYRKTHWIATIDAPHGRGVFDVNAVGAIDGKCTGWTTAQGWAGIVVPWLTEGIKGADGTSSATHSIEIVRCP